MLTVGSLFAGIGGFDLGLERAGMRSVWQCELDPYAERVLARHWPDVLRVRDVRDVNASTVPAVDLVCAGWPCPGFSVAGLGEGFDHEGSGLWVEIVRVVRDLRPRYLVLENVAALLARGLWRVLGDLAALGYDAEWDCIPASALGAPHQRDRFWLVAYPQEHGRGQGRSWRPPASDPRQPQPERALQVVADPAGARLEGRQQPATARASLREFACRHRDAGGAWADEPSIPRVAHGVPDWVDRMRATGNALVPQIAEWIGRRIIDYEQGGLSDAA